MTPDDVELERLAAAYDRYYVLSELGRVLPTANEVEPAWVPQPLGLTVRGRCAGLE